MALYGLSQRTTNVTIANPNWEVRSTAANKPKIMELGVSQVTAAATSYGIGRPGAIGVTPTTPQTFVDEGDGNGPAANTTAAVAWGTAPTVPTNFNRRFSCASAAGVGVIFTFPRGLGIPVTGSIIIWNITASVTLDVYAVVDE